ncbi:MAG: CDP-alcohol phosphatidyltransferase family protein [Anaerolineales bacterium]|nr:CDP-alcohol phosphatidyltransferase family protein [Anaerolineales bacterium]MCX7754873.1 CDP-alcohol phosphatidyltransferase family protein [Anaerolineales bacterium]MDW8278699.1 CDP-alcohol phosphatidyltransferase family protein [Anaerolineales bacterium]
MKNNLLFRKTLAFGVHFFTATGSVWGLLAIYAIFEREWRLAILWMMLAMVVDGFDGMLARWTDVKRYAPNIDGALMDNILDYLNYVLVPVIFLLQANLLPAMLAWPAAFAILLTSAYQFTQVDAKTDETNDYFFKGFPCYWNVMVLYMLIMQMNPWLNLFFVVFFSILVFVPVKWVYPSRNTRLKRLTLALSYLYGIIGVWGVIQYPNVPGWVVWASFVYVGYYVVLSLWPRKSIQLAAE